MENKKSDAHHFKFEADSSFETLLRRYQMSETVFEVPVNPTGGNHSTDDKTSKSADNNQPSPDKEDKAETPTNTGFPVRRPLS